MTAAGLSDRNGRDFRTEPGEDRAGDQDVRREPGRAREQPEGRIALHASPPARTVVPSTEREDGGGPSSSASSAASSAPARKSDFASTSASTAVRPTTVTRSRSVSAGDPVRGSMRWCVSPTRRPPAAAVRARGCDRSARQLEREYSRVRLHADGPRSSADREVSARAHEARPERRQQLACAVDRVALPDAAEVELDARPERDLPRSARDRDRSQAARRRTRRDDGPARRRAPRTSCRSRRRRAPRAPSGRSVLLCAHVPRARAR